ncbi:SMP-30/gluconolactonase/LRE family protein [Phenylobacterium sp.]|uniref:SMP-30/gluconolactonase/LRE family protein n=1 Tax=Phenylobacterium sp. TaxID=1871053 RepID=UPI0035649B96
MSRTRLTYLALAALIGLVAPATAKAAAMTFAEFETTLDATENALGEARFDAALAGTRRLMQVTPHLPGVELLNARALAGAGQADAAVAAYAALVDQGVGAAVAADPAFASLEGRPGWTSLRRRALAQRPIGADREAFRLADPRLIPEGLAFDPATGRFFASSTFLRKVVVRDRSGRTDDFVQPKDHGLLQALGLKVDAARRTLFVCTGADDNHLQDTQPADIGRSGVLVYNLNTGQLRAAAWVGDGRSHLFNDLAVGPDGSAYVTDSRDGRIFVLDGQTRRLTPLTGPDSLLYPNGIAIDPKGRVLFVADLAGVARIDVRTGKITRMAEPAGVASGGIDGLYLYRRQLIGVQSGFGVNRVMAFRLDRTMTKVVTARALARDDPQMKAATEGVVVGASLVFIADSQQNAFTVAGALKVEGLNQTPVLSVRLRR